MLRTKNNILLVTHYSGFLIIRSLLFVCLCLKMESEYQMSNAAKDKTTFMIHRNRLSLRLSIAIKFKSYNISLGYLLCSIYDLTLKRITD